MGGIIADSKRATLAPMGLLERFAINAQGVNNAINMKNKTENAILISHRKMYIRSKLSVHIKLYIIISTVTEPYNKKSGMYEWRFISLPRYTFEEQDSLFLLLLLYLLLLTF